MGKKCVYCRELIYDERAIDVCDNCGIKVWGKKMFDAIKSNMDNAKDNNDLCDPGRGDSPLKR